MNIQNKTILITGANRGIGWALVNGASARSKEGFTMDSSGIRLLSRFLTSTKQQGGSLKLVNPSKFVVQTLKLVGLLNLFETFPDTQAAAASFS